MPTDEIPAGPQRLLRFGTFELDSKTCELRRQGVLVRLPLQPARVLRLLATRAGELVTREELRREIWGEEVFVDHEAGLAACVNQVRTALGDRAASPRFVETLPRQGYRFIAEVRTDTRRAETAAAPSRQVSADPRPAPAIPASSGGRLRVAMAATVILASIAGLAGLVAARRLWPTRERVPSVIVLPISTPPGDAALAAIGETLLEGVIGELATIAGPRARIASRAQTATLRGRDVDLDDIRALGADYFVAITLRHAGEPVRVHAKLAHGSGWILWSIDYDFAAADLATLQTDIAAALARRTEHEIIPPSDDSPAREPAPAAVPDYAQANGDAENGRLPASIEGYERALRIDPHHLGSYEGLAEAHLSQALRDPEHAPEHFAAAQAAVDRALAIDPRHAGALTARGALLFARDFEPAPAERVLRRAIELEPALPAARLWHAEVLAALGDFDGARAQAQAGRELTPMSLVANRVLGHVQLIAGDYAALRQQAGRVLALDHAAAGPHLWLAIANERLGDEPAAAMARRSFVAASGLSPPAGGLSWDQVYLALAATSDGQTPWRLAVAAALSDRPVEAMRWLEVCRRQRVVDLLWAAHNPMLQSLRAEPKFAALLAQEHG